MNLDAYLSGRLFYVCKLRPEAPVLQSKWISSARTLLTIAVIGFLVNALISNWKEIQAHQWQLRPELLVLAGALTLAFILLHSVLWAKMLKLLGLSLAYPTGIRLYLLAHLTRYIPGGIWPFATLSLYGRENQIPASILIALLALDMVFVAWVSALFSLPILYRLEVLSLTSVAILALLAVVASLALGPVVLRRALLLVTRWQRLSPAVAIQKLASYKDTWFLLAAYGALHALLLLSFGIFMKGLTPLETGDALYTGIAWSGAWLIGFLIVFLPSGLGAREASLVLFLQPVLAAPVAGAAAVAHRFLGTLIDLLILVAVYVFLAAARKRVPHEESVAPRQI